MNRAAELQAHYQAPDQRAAHAAEPDRPALAAAISAHDAAAERLDRVRSALDRATPPWQAAERLEAAEAALAEARQTHAATAVARLLGDPSSPDPVTPAAAAYAKAEAALAEARQTHDLLTTQLADAGRAEAWHRARLGAAVGDALRASPEVAALAEAFAAAQYRLADLRAALRAVSAANGIPEVFRFWDAQHGYRDDQLPSIAAWRDAIAALAEDPNTPLPGLPSRSAA
jgi:hypothetical protein